MQQNIGNIFNLVHKNCHKILHMLLFNNIYGIDWHFLKEIADNLCKTMDQYGQAYKNIPG